MLMKEQDSLVNFGSSTVTTPVLLVGNW